MVEPKFKEGDMVIADNCNSSALKSLFEPFVGHIGFVTRIMKSKNRSQQLYKVYFPLHDNQEQSEWFESELRKPDIDE